MTEYTCFYCHEVFKSKNKWARHSTTCKVVAPVKCDAHEIVASVPEVKLAKQVKPVSYIAVIDTETTGLAPQSNWIVEIGVSLYESEHLDKPPIDWSVIVKPDEYLIPTNSIRIHGITNEYAHANGISMYDALTEFEKRIRSAKLVIGHNLQFDVDMIYENACRINHPIREYIKKCEKYCTLLTYRHQTGTKIKLCDFYKKITGSEMENSHRVLDDIHATFFCYVHQRINSTHDCKFCNSSSIII